MKYLVVFSITPVQAFIARARKLRDFYAGSKILSYLASVGFNAIKGEKLYPSADSNSMPNKFVFSIDAEDTKQVKSEMGRIEEVIKNAWLELADITGVSKNCVDDYWNYSWAAVPYKKNYKEAHSKVQKLLAAMKLKPHKIRKSQAGEKCHLCGENSVWKEFDADKKDKREKLCGVCTIKRDLPDLKTSIPKNHQLLNLLSKPEYSSTTKISAHKFIKKYNLDKDEIAKLNDTNSDGRGNSLPNKERYYALLAMDGDKMGDLVNTKITSEEHLELSKKLDSFDRKVENLSCFKGTAKLIYAGGDDVFAILPLEEAIAIAKEIRELYTDIVAKEEKTTSISAAIVIAHHKEPLREVIRDTHEVLDTIAKEKAGRDALAIRLKKRGGGDRDLFFKWDAKNPFNANESLFDSLEKVRESLSENKLTSSLIYRLTQLEEAIAVKEISEEQILKLFEYEVAHSIGKEKARENAKRLAGLCLAGALDENNKFKKDEEIFNPEAAVIAHFLSSEKEEKNNDLV